MISKKSGVKELKTDPAGRWVVVAILAFAAALAIVAALGHPRVRIRPQEPASRVRLAVLPFENQTGNAALEVLASDVTLSITRTLESSAGERFEVVPREASLSFKDLARGIADVAEALDCDYVIAGRVDANDEGIVVDLFLFKAGVDPKFWPDRLVWERSRLETLPGEIAARIQSTLVDIEAPDDADP